MDAIVDDLDVGNERIAWLQVAEDMKKPVFNRTELEFSRLMTLMVKLPFFKTLNFTERLALAKVVSFHRFGAGEVILVKTPAEEKAAAQLREDERIKTQAKKRASVAVALESNIGVSPMAKSEDPPSSSSGMRASATPPPGTPESSTKTPQAPSASGAPPALDEEYLRSVETAILDARTREEEKKLRGGAKVSIEDDGDPFYIIVFGDVALQHQSSVGRVQTLLATGDTFGNPLIMNAIPDHAAYVASSNVEVLRITYAQYNEFLAHQEQGVVDERVHFFQHLVVPVLTSMPSTQLERLARAAYPVHYQSKELVVREGEPADNVYFIVKGKLKVVREVDFTHVAGGIPTVKLLELAILVEGEYFGELSFLRYNVDANRRPKWSSVANGLDSDEDDHSDSDTDCKQLNPANELTPRQATVYAHTPSTLLVLPREKFMELVTDTSLVRFREYAKGYPSQQEIRQHFTKQQQWDKFKGDVMGRVSKHGINR